MNPASPKWISRKEISILTGFTVDRVRRSECHLGLDQFKVVVNPRTILYQRVETITHLHSLKLIVVGTY